MSQTVRAMIVAAIVSVAAVGGGGTSASAREGTVGSNTITDPCGDGTPGHADIKSVSIAMSAPGQGTAPTIDWTIVACSGFTTAKAPCVHILSLRPAGAAWGVCRGNPKQVAPPCIISISLSRPYRAGGGCGGPAAVSRPDKKTIVYKVPRKTFAGSKVLTPAPKAIKWQANVQDYPDCTRPCDDTAYGTLAL